MGKRIARRNYNTTMQRCRQEPEREDCFARTSRGNCQALADTDYPCGGCPFYKPAAVYAAEQRRTYSRLILLERTDLIMKYEVPAWMED